MLYWNYTKEGIPYLESDSILHPSSPPPSDNFKRMLRDFLQRMRDNDVKIVIKQTVYIHDN